MMEFNFKEALMDVIHLAQEGNYYFQRMEPWNVKDEERLKEILYTCGVTVKYIVYLLYPFMPNKCMELLDIMNEELDLNIRGNKLKKVNVVFKKIEDKEIEVAKREILNIEDIKEDNMITVEDFGKLDLRIGQIVEAEDIAKSRKLLKLIVDVGGEKRQIVAGIKGHYKPEELIGKKVVVLCNLKPAKLCGVESQGMILAGGEDKVALLVPDRDLPVGSKVK